MFQQSIERLIHIVRAYDIRGIVPIELNENDAFVLGLILGRYFNSKCIFVGRDNRITSLDLYQSIISGFNSCGLTIHAIGIVSTPLLYYRTFSKKNSLGVMITASHNACTFNGFKIIFNKKIVDGKQLLKILNSCLIYDNKIYNINNSDYINYLLNRSELISVQQNIPIKILWDCNNGATQQLVRTLTQHLKNDNTIINCNENIIGTPDPTCYHNIQFVQKIIHNYDIAICFDGDGDRILIVLKNGDILRGDKILLIIAEYLASLRNDTQNIVVDIKTSCHIIHALKLLKYNVYVQKTGHSFIKQMMYDTQSMLGGEVSGHIFFNYDNNTPYDDAMLAACYILKIILTNGDFIAKVLLKIPQTIIEYDIKIPCEKTVQELIINHLKKDLYDKDIICIDGIKYESDIGWWLVRSSNTENALIICIEAYNISNFNLQMEYLKKIFNTYNVTF